MSYTERWTITKTSAMICALVWLLPNRPRATGTLSSIVVAKEPVGPVETGYIRAVALARLDRTRLSFTDINVFNLLT
jgi:hypothetical protein